MALTLLMSFTIPISVKAAPSGYDIYGELSEEMYQDDLGLLAMVVYAEAGNQDLYGKRLVVDTVLNRVDSPYFPNTIRDVIYQKNQFSTIYILGPVTDECYEAVALELEERSDPQVLFFNCIGFTEYGSPAYKYGDHYFSYWRY